MSDAVRIVAVLAPRWCGASALAAELTALADAGCLLTGVTVPTASAWFGRFRDGVTVHPELVELSGGRRDGDRDPRDEADAAGSRAVTTSGPVVRVGDRVEQWRPRPPQSRQVVRDRLKRVAADARETGVTTVLLVAPGAAWAANPAGLRRELSTVADEVTIALLVRHPADALAAALAASVRVAERSGIRTLSARTALAQAAWVDELRYAAMLERWVDGAGPRSPGLTLVPAEAGAAHDLSTVWASLGLDQAASPAIATAPDDRARVLPPASRTDLEAVADRATQSTRWALTARTRHERAARLEEARDWADANASAADADPFAFSPAERAQVARRFRRDLDAVKAAVVAQWPNGVPDDAAHASLRSAWIAWFADAAPR